MDRELKVKKINGVVTQTTFERVYACAFCGAVAWTVYAIVECWFSFILLWVIKQRIDFTPLHWGFTVLLFIIYPIGGLIVGSFCGLIYGATANRISFIQRLKPSLLIPLISTFTIILAFNVNLIINYSTSSIEFLGISELPLIFISILMIFCLVLSANSLNWFIRLRFLTNPCTVSIALVGLPWIHNELLFSYSTIVNAIGALGYIIVIVVISIVVQKARQTKPEPNFITWAPQVSAKYIISLIITVPFVLVITFFLKQTPIRDNSNLKASPANTNLPNIILITMDTVRADHLSLYGYKRDTTPNLKKLSQEAALYNRAIASGDMTLSTHASIFTGMYARQHGAHFDPWNGYPTGRPLADKFDTLAEVLSEKGYLTAGIVANYTFLSHAYRLNQGFQYYDNRTYVPLLGDAAPYYIRQGIRQIFAHFAPREAFDLRCHRAEKINNEIFSFLDKTNKDDRPFFLFINYMDAHEPYIPPSPYDRLYEGKSKTFTSADYFKLAWDVVKLQRKVTEEEQKHLISQYDGEISYLDFHIGKLIERLKKIKLYEDSMIIVTSDHGEAFGEKNLFNHGCSVYQDQVYIPLIIKYPSSRQKRVIDDVVSVVNIMPTILDVLGDDEDGYVEAQSLLKLETGEKKSVICESFPSGHLVTLHPRFERIEHAIFYGPYKFIRSSAGKKELYKLTKDPDEEINLYQPNDSVSAALENMMSKWLNEITAETDLPGNEMLDKATLNRLKTLGYIQ